MDETAITELDSYITNNGELYRRMTNPIEKNLSRKWKAGTYNHDLAIRAWFNLAVEGAKEYHKEYGAKDSPWFAMFPPAVRWEVAKRLADRFKAEAELGNLAA